MARGGKGVKRGPQSEEHKAKLSAIRKGKPMSEAHKAAISAARRKSDRCRGAPLSDEHKKAVSDGLKRKYANDPSYKLKLTIARLGVPKAKRAVAMEEARAPKREKQIAEKKVTFGGEEMSPETYEQMRKILFGEFTL